MTLALVRRRLGRSSLAIFALSLLPALANAQGTRADYEGALGLRERYESLAIKVAGPATWIDGTHPFVPGAGHRSGGAYGEGKRFDFFAQHLPGKTPPAWNETPSPPTSSGSR